MKKNILLLIVTLFTIFWVNNTIYWASYVPLPVDWDHYMYVNNLKYIVSRYLDSHNQQIWNIYEIRNLVYSSIASQWWVPTYALTARVVNWRLIVWCGNQDMLSFAINPTSVTPLNYTTAWTCSTYISDWSENWGSCAISWNWNTDWTVKCTQTSTWSQVDTSCWINTYRYVTTCYWTECSNSPEVYSCVRSNCPSDVVRPANRTADTTLQANINTPTSNCLNLFANNSSICSFTIGISWTTRQDRAITWLSWLEVKNIQDKSNQASNLIDWSYNFTTNNALNFSWVNNTAISLAWSNYQIRISWIKSRSPFKRDDWKVSFDLQWVSSFTTININGIKYDFKKPFIWVLKSSLDGINWLNSPILWTIMNYKLELQEDSTLLIWSLSNYKLDNFISKIKPAWDDSVNLKLQDIEVDWTTLDDKSWSLFSARINTSENTISSLPIPWIQVESPYIEYKLEWHTVKYILSEGNTSNDTTPISITWEEFLWVKVVWNLQWAWKQTVTWQNKNFSDFSKLDVRADIRKNAYTLTKGMTNWQILNWVKYVEWDKKLSELLDINSIETLIIKNGNFIIDGNLNSSWNKFWIIVLKDSYNVNSDYSNKWNIYIDKNVTYIEALLYADGWIISSVLWVPYTSDSSSRTTNLQEQLILKWSIFTRNTIGWAILSWGDYILPGGVKTSDFNKAMIYDLNYIRRWNNWCNKWWTSWCNDSWEYKEPFVIIYNSKAQTNPPKWFSK